MILNEVMKDTADAIREKTGKSDLIAPVNFAGEIKAISVGGGESGENQIIYLNIKAYIDYAIEQVGEDMLPMLIKTLPGAIAVSIPADDTFRRIIVPPAYLDTVYLKYIDRCAFATNFLCILENTELNSSDILPQMLQMGCFEITKEEFYNLNA